jgi:hypothetical protein
MPSGTIRGYNPAPCWCPLLSSVGRILPESRETERASGRQAVFLPTTLEGQGLGRDGRRRGAVVVDLVITVVVVVADLAVTVVAVVVDLVITVPVVVVPVITWSLDTSIMPSSNEELNTLW